MKIFSLDKDYEIVWEPQVLLLEPFSKLFKRDKSENKTKANKEMAFVYFFCDIRSDYAIYIDPEEKTKVLKKELKFSSNWKPDKVLNEAIEFYRKRSKSTISKILEDSTYVANKVSEKLREAVDEDLEIGDLDKVLNGLNKIPNVIKAIKIAEKEVLKEIEEAQDNIGAKNKALFEDLQLND